TCGGTFAVPAVSGAAAGDPVAKPPEGATLPTRAPPSASPSTQAGATLPTQGGVSVPSSVAEPPAPPPSGSRFRVLRSHARGGLGEVFVALDEELGREVALKEIQPRYADDHEGRERFLREARLTGLLEHPSIVPVYGLGRYPDGRPYYAMR